MTIDISKLCPAELVDLGRRMRNAEERQTKLEEIRTHVQDPLDDLRRSFNEAAHVCKGNADPRYSQFLSLGDEVSKLQYRLSEVMRGAANG